MTAIAIPAIDLLDGRVVRLRQGSYDHATEYSLEPERVAAGFAEQGATLLHVIDLSAARDGQRPDAHAAVLRRLVDGSGMAVQVGGGIRSRDDVLAALELGVARVLVGTLAARDPRAVGALAAETARVAVAADVREGTVRAAGWLEDTGTPGAVFVRRLVECGVRDFLVTAIERDGTGGLLLAAGGIGSAADVVAAAAAGADGIVIGRALYEGELTLPEASASLRSSPTDSPS